MKMRLFPSFLLLALLTCFYSPVQGQDSYVKNASDTSSTYTITMKDGSVLNGRILQRTKTEIVFYDLNIGQVTIKTNKIKTMQKISDDTYVSVTMKNGSRVVGRMISKNDSVMVVNSGSLGEVSLKMSEVKEMKMIDKTSMKNGEYRFANPLGAKYFMYGPCAIVQKKDEGYFQNTYLAYNSMDYGITERVTVGGGALGFVLPFVNVKTGFEIAPRLHAGAGGYLMIAPFFSDLGLPWAMYGAVTYGTREKNLSGGIVWAGAAGEALPRPVYSLSGQFRFGRRSAFISENYFYPVADYGLQTNNNYYISSTSYYYRMVYTYGVRILGERTSWDIGFLGISEIAEEIPIGIPFVSYNMKF